MIFKTIKGIAGCTHKKSALICVGEWDVRFDCQFKVVQGDGRVIISKYMTAFHRPKYDHSLRFSNDIVLSYILVIVALVTFSQYLTFPSIDRCNKGSPDRCTKQDLFPERNRDDKPLEGYADIFHMETITRINDVKSCF